MPRILFHFQRPVQIAALSPVIAQLRSLGDFELGASIQPLNMVHLDGFTNPERSLVDKLNLPIIDDAHAWRPDATVMAENYAPRFEGCGKLILVPERLSSKGYLFTQRDTSKRDNLLDLICAPGPLHMDALSASGNALAEAVETGFPKLDPLFSPAAQRPGELKMHAGIDPEKKVLLFAPTHETPRSAVPILWTRIRHLASEERHLLIKLHNRSPFEWRIAFRELAKDHPHITNILEPDITPYLGAADLIISDLSSAYLEAVLLDKPVVLYRNPNYQQYPFYHAEDIEYICRSATTVVRSIKELHEAIDDSLTQPGRLQAERADVGRKLDRRQDGKAALRVANTIKRLLQQPVVSVAARDSGSLATTTVLLPLHAGDASLVEATRSTLEQAGLSCQVLLLGASPQDSAWFEALAEWKPEASAPGELESHRYIQQAEHLVWLQPGVSGWRKWLKRLQAHLLRQTDKFAVVPQMGYGAPVQDPELRLGAGAGEDGSYEELDQQVKLRIPGEVISLNAPAGKTCILLNNRTGNRSTILTQLEGADPNFFTPDGLVAMDVIMQLPVENRIDERHWSAPLAPVQQELALQRVQELKTWIQLPLGINVDTIENRPKTAAGNGGGSAGDTAAENAPLRLAKHYLHRGKPEAAIRHVRRGLQTTPDHEELLRLARELGIKEVQEEQS